MAVMLRDIRQAILIALLSVVSVFKYSQTLPLSKGEPSQGNWYNKYSDCPYPVFPILANKTSHVGEMCDPSLTLSKKFIAEACSTFVNVSNFICMSNETIPKNASFILDPDAIHQIVENGSVCDRIKAEENQTMMIHRSQFSFLYKLKTEYDFCVMFCADKNNSYLCVLLLNGLQIIRNMQASKVASSTEKKVPDQQAGLPKPHGISPVEGKGEPHGISPVEGKGEPHGISPVEGKGESQGISPVEGKGEGAANLSPNIYKPSDGGSAKIEPAKSKLNTVEISASNEIPTTLINKPRKEASSTNTDISSVDISGPAVNSVQKNLSSGKSETITNKPPLQKETIPQEAVNTDNKKPLSMPKLENKQPSSVTEKIVTTTLTSLPKYETSVKSQLDESNKGNSDTQISNPVQKNSDSNKKNEPSKTDTAEIIKDASTLKDLERKDFQEEKTDAPEGGLSASNTKPIDDDSFGEEDNEDALGEQPEDIISPDKGQSIRKGGGGAGAGDGQDMDTEFTEFSGYTDSHFFPYILTISVLCIIVYLIFHNKQKILAIIIEGKNKQRRRPNTSNYKKLDSNVEEVMHRPASAVSTAHIIY